MARNNGIYTDTSAPRPLKSITRVLGTIAFLLICAVIGFVISLQASPNSKELKKALEENIALQTQIDELSVENERLNNELEKAKKYTTEATPTPTAEPDEEGSEDSSYNDDDDEDYDYDEDDE